MSITHIVLLLLVVVLIFGTKKLRNIGSDLGGAMRDFKKGMDGDEEAKEARDREERLREERLRAEPPRAEPTSSQVPPYRAEPPYRSEPTASSPVPPSHDATEPRDRAP